MELNQESCGQVITEGFVVLISVLSIEGHCFVVAGDEESGSVEEGSLLENGNVVLEMLGRVL